MTHVVDPETWCCVWCGTTDLFKPCTNRFALPSKAAVKEGLRANVMPGWLPSSRNEWR